MENKNIKYQDKKQKKEQEKSKQVDYTIINLLLAKEIYRHKLITTFRAFVALKLEHRNGIMPHREAAETIKEYLSHSDTRAANKALEQMIRLGWAGIDKNNVVYLRAYKGLERKYGITTRAGAKIYKQDLEHIREWILSYTLARREKAFLRSPKKITGVPHLESKVNATQVSITVICKELGISRGMACRLKQSAARLGYFSYKNDSDEYKSRRGNIRIPVMLLEHVKKLLGNEALYNNYGRIYERLTSVYVFNYNYEFKRRPI